MVEAASQPSNVSIYDALDPRSKQIRILQLIPGSFEDNIKCRISVATVEAPFEALSYVWGDPAHRETIEVQQQIMSITRNLDEALRHLRDTCETRELWVDAICINQNDISERTHQVGIMDDIYRKAQKVVVWLGKEAADSAIELIRLQAENADHHWCQEDEGKEDTHQAGQVLQLRMFLTNTQWYRRIWTLQEVVLAKSVIYVCGKNVFANGEIDGLIHSFFTHFGRKRCCRLDKVMGPVKLLGVGQNVWSYLEQLSDLEEARSSQESLRFLDIACKSRHREATNPRDKVFGLVGLTKDITKDIIDYHSSVADVYTRATIQTIRNTGNLDVLSHVLPRGWTKALPAGPRYRTPGLPSWVPDWSDTLDDEKWRQRELIKREKFSKFFRACGREETPYVRVCEDDTQRLIVKGRLCGTITFIGDPFSQNDVFGQYDWKVHRQWRRMAQVDRRPEAWTYRVTNNTLQKGSTLLDTFWRTLCANIDPIVSSSVNIHEADLTTRVRHDRWWWYSMQRHSIQPTPEMLLSQEFGATLVFDGHVKSITAGRKFFISVVSGTLFFGLAPEGSREGDQIWVINGGRKPVILRPVAGAHEHSGRETNDNGLVFTFIGDSYVHGLMNGELVEDSGTPETTLTLI